MRAIYYIAARDFKSLWRQPTMQFMLMVQTAFFSFLYLRSLMSYAARARTMGGPLTAPNLQMDLFAHHISALHLILILFAPVLTMRALADERRSNTFAILASSPISSLQITLGKFCFAFASAFVVIIISLLYPIATSALTSFNWWPLMSAYLGITLLAAIYVSIGLASSAMSDSIILSVVLGWILSAVVFFAGQVGLNNNESSFWSPIFAQSSLMEHFYALLQGVLKTKGLVFMATLSAFFLFLTQRIIELARWR